MVQAICHGSRRREEVEEASGKRRKRQRVASCAGNVLYGHGSHRHQIAGGDAGPSANTTEGLYKRKGSNSLWFHFHSCWPKYLPESVFGLGFPGRDASRRGLTCKSARPSCKNRLSGSCGFLLSLTWACAAKSATTGSLKQATCIRR